MMRILLILFIAMLVSGCHMVKHEAEREMQEEVGKVLDRDLESRVKQLIKAEGSEVRTEISVAAIEVLDKEIPADYRSTIRVTCKHGAKGLLGILALLSGKLGLDLRAAKKNGNGGGNTSTTA